MGATKTETVTVDKAELDKLRLEVAALGHFEQLRENTDDESFMVGHIWGLAEELDRIAGHDYTKVDRPDELHDAESARGRELYRKFLKEELASVS